MTDAGPYGVVLFCLLASLAGVLAGCSSGTVAPVQLPTEPVIPAREREYVREYVVESGDTVYSIAWRHGIDYRVLAEFNSIRDPFTIFPGQHLRIPGLDDTTSPASKPSATTSEPTTSSDVSVHGIGTESAPVLQPLPLPPQPSGPSAKLPDETPRKAPAQPPEPVLPSKPAAKPSLAARVVAGLRWSRPTSGKTIGGFGRGGNKGLDIAGAFEQSIHAASRGRVVYAGSGLVGYGKLVIVKHDDHLLSAYAHNERLHVKEGDEVGGGQHIADMGRSGKGQAMLHFEIRRDGKPVDPLRFLP